MSADDYSAFVAGLKKKFPAQPFLIVRYGDHQPEFSSDILDPGLDEASVAARNSRVSTRVISRPIMRSTPSISNR